MLHLPHLIATNEVMIDAGKFWQQKSICDKNANYMYIKYIQNSSQKRTLTIKRCCSASNIRWSGYMPDVGMPRGCGPPGGTPGAPGGRYRPCGPPGGTQNDFGRLRKYCSSNPSSSSCRGSKYRCCPERSDSELLITFLIN
jgi:hypothetical protein